MLSETHGADITPWSCTQEVTR